MPRDAGGIYTLPDGYLAVTGETVLPSNHNPPLEDLAAAVTNSLPRNGAAAMTDDLNLGANQIKNVAAATLATDAPTWDQAKAYTTLTSGTASAAASKLLDLSSYVTAGYRRFRIHLFGITPASAGASLGAGLSTNGGSTYISSGITQQTVETWGAAGYAQYDESTLGGATMYLAGLLSAGAPSAQTLELTLGATNTFWKSRGYTYSTGGSGESRCDGQVLGAVNALLFGFDTGNMATFEYAVEGFR